jgi:decaprenylphospho-beta-D-erythro-pentofuranosid-2-ulose 2-reductase
MPTVLILGAASDMAVAVARKYAAAKYDLLLAARNTARLDSLASDLKIRYNVNCNLVEFDALDYASHASFYNSLPQVPEVVVCVFGYLGDQDKAMQDWNHASQIIQSNYTGAVSVLNIVAASFVSRGSGTIVGISSVAGDRGRKSNYIYGSAKAGFTAYLSGLRNDLFHKGVHVMTVLPGFVNTNMTSGLKLPPLLTAQPGEVATAIFNAAKSKKNIIYVKWMWRWIMLIIRNIPEFMFKKMKL